jgi:hypothetical protein
MERGMVPRERLVKLSKLLESSGRISGLLPRVGHIEYLI